MNFSLLVMIFFKYNISCTIILKKINLLLLLFFILSRRNPLRGVALHAALNSPRTSPTQRCVIQGVYPNRNPPSRWSCCGFESSGRGRGRTHCRGGTAMGNAQQKPPGSGGGGSGPGAMGNGSRFKEVANENAERISPGGLEGPQCPAVDQSYLDAPAGGLPPHLARIKNEGNYLFKQGQFGDALDKYTKAIDGCAQAGNKQVVYLAGISNPEDLCVLYTNRAACYLKDGNSADCIEDCTKALQLQPYHLKALLRRAMAYESLERYRRAYADYKTVLQMDTGVQAAHDSVHRVAGVVEPIPAIIRQEAGYTLNWLPANRRAHTNKQPFALTFTPTGSLESPIHACFWDVGGNRSARRKPTQARGEHANSTQPRPGIEPQSSEL
ncbi:sperm-associated antigen 1A isoform X3 [Phyllopteryx taeniolatus]|uniref:sperm-associated antigen 1A isoform X3 n=1 Tax=Phyllopteryx taeniolatus TaxID=161469 RepID=UPI002AD55374|nr:sperm-associated antigen 1A isoform X3 [Phyllopteryx taeniolatus]